MKKGFTLIELLAVIVILSVISLITIPIVIGIVDEIRMSSYKESLKGVFNATDFYIASNEFIDFPEEGINVIDAKIEMKNKDFTSGKIIKNEDGQFELDKISDGYYCGSGTLDNLIVIEGSCDSLDTTPPTITIGSSTVTSSSISIVADAEDLESGISGYEFSKDNGVTWTTIQASNIYNFTDLTNNTNYTFKVRVYNNNNLNAISDELIVTTNNIPTPTYSVDITGWSQSKTVTITYPERQVGYIYEYSLDAGSTWEEVVSPATTKDITFNEDGNVIARISDGTNIISGATYEITNIDTTSPIITLLGDNPLTITEGTVFNDPGVTAFDDKIGDITSEIQVTGTVDYNVIGTYTLTYSVSDSAGNEATVVVREVVVEEDILVANYGSNLQTSYSNIYATWTDPDAVTNTGDDNYYNGNYKYPNSIYSNIGLDYRLLNVVDNPNRDYQYITSGTKTYTFNYVSEPQKWIGVLIRGGGMTTNVYVGSFKIVFNNNVKYTLQQAVNNGYIEPLVICSSSSTNSSSYLFGNVNNVISGGYTSTSDFPKLMIIFKTKDIPIKAVEFYSNRNFSTTYDGLRVKEYNDEFDLSISPFE